MKTRKSILTVLFIGVMLMANNVTAQETEVKQVVEITYILPKIGHGSDFTAAAKTHNETFHNEAPYNSSLALIMTGKEAGWHVWIMGPCSFAELENRPDTSEHNDHWENEVAPHIAKFGRTEYWRFNPELSYPSYASEEIKYETIWFVEVKQGGDEKLREFLKKVKKVYETMGNDDYREYYSMFKGGDGRDIAIVFPHKSLGDIDVESEFFKTFAEVYGEGSFEEAVKDWQAATGKINQQLWKVNAY